MKILWLSNKVLSERDSGATGTWLDAMAQGLVEAGELKLGNISQGSVKETTRYDYNAIQQWIVPSNAKPNRDGLPSRQIVEAIVRAIEEFSPDLVHVWGVESFWGLLYARNLIDIPSLLDMQGLKGAISRVYHGGLSLREQLSCIGIKEIIRQSSIFQDRLRFERWGVIENEIITRHRFITIQSDWMKAQVKAINNTAQIFDKGLVLRESFCNAKQWQFSGNPIIFCSAAYPSPFKGVHTAIHALAILRAKYPTIQLRISGSYQRTGFRQDGYVSWLNREAKRLGVESNLCWLGSLNASELVKELLKCSAIVLPTFIESYCLALAEAMILGVPAVVSFTGGTSFLAQNEESALFFSPGDESMCAYQLDRILHDQSLAVQLSCRAREQALIRNNRKQIIRRQIEIYHQVLGETVY